ncbi:RICIN domain-containing protein [Streptomyces sp. NPDC047315]|uniref:RICIN domain-containing protein n=1 Tax=Streptomyces sp. NPDC047315 TaxID=3155142 RepID=UPI0033ED804F
MPMRPKTSLPGIGLAIIAACALALAPHGASASAGGEGVSGEGGGWRPEDGARVVDVSSIAEIAAAERVAAPKRGPGERIVYRLRFVITQGVEDRAACLDADANTIDQNGTKIQIWTCNRNANQTWYFSTARYNTSYFEIQIGEGDQPTRCLDVDANTLPANGTKIQLWDCNGNSNQVWFFDIRQNLDTLFSLASGKCLDVDANTLPANGTKVQLWSCHNGSNQLWDLLQ